MIFLKIYFYYFIYLYVCMCCELEGTYISAGAHKGQRPPISEAGKSQL